jgi:ABC-type polysaccharide/polyol phosphate transport system ATPase subunit
MSAAIEIRGVEKVFRVYPDLVRSRIKQRVLFWRKYYREKRALADIDLTVQRGEVMGVLGPNGAGKTTLLKIIAGISHPTRGTVLCRGEVVPVLALGLGFHPRLTGLQNLEFAGMMLGMSRKEVRARRDWIIEFSELGDAIDNPLTSYSSGMRARLSFAIAACREPEILIIDEALATGDIRFVQKCIRRIHEIVQSGTTALFVSHNIWSIKRLTRRSILISDGRIIDDGDTNEVADRYYEVMLQQETMQPTAKDYQLSEFVGTGEVVLRAIKLLDPAGQEANVFDAGTRMSIVLTLFARMPLQNVSFSLIFRRTDGVTAFCLGQMAGGTLQPSGAFEDTVFALPAGESTVELTLDPLLLAPSDFFLDLHLFDFKDFSGFTSNQQYYFKTHICDFGVRRIKNPNRTVTFYHPGRLRVLRADG